MAYVFTRESNLGVMRNSATSEKLASSETATIKSIGNDISIWFGSTNLGFAFSDISTIGGVTPANVDDAVLLLGGIFKGATITVIIN